jgi:two-component system response regulator YesN
MPGVQHMLKILVVDDEKLIRKGLVKTIGALGEEYLVVGEAADGMEALAVIEKERPDIVITDIKMPKMDGIELITNLEKSFPAMKKVVLSGYDEFNYVRDTMKRGAADYLLKPVDLEQLGELLKKIEQEIRSEEESSIHALNLENKLNKSFPLLKEQFIHELVCEKKSEVFNKIEEKLQYFNLRLSAGAYQVMIVSIDNYRYLQKEIGSEQLKISSFIQRSISEEAVSGYTDFFSCMEDAGLVIACCIPKNTEEILRLISGEILNNLEKNTALQYTISIGKPAESLEKLKESYDSALDTLGERFYRKGSKIIRFDEGRKHFNGNQLQGLTDHYEIRFKSCVDVANEQQVTGVAEEFCAKLEERSVEPSDALKVLSDIFAKLQFENVKFKEAVVETYGFDYSYEKNLGLFDTMDEVRRYTCNVYTEVLGRLKAMYSRKDRKLIELVKEYIQKHYREDITLSRVADEVYVNPNYLSEIFKAQTGESFVDYFTRVRIEKAKELIKDIRVKTYEVGELVGYEDPAYFSKVFKKVVGVSPTEYRNLVR